MKITKSDISLPAFELVSRSTSNADGTCTCCGQPIGVHAHSVQLKEGVQIGGESLSSREVVLPGTLSAGTDYSIVLSDGRLRAQARPDPDAVGGFHVLGDGKILAESFWDPTFRPKCQNPRGMALVAGVFWLDIYEMNTNPGVNGTSCAGVEIADGSSPIIVGEGLPTRRADWWGFTDVLAAHGKQLPSLAECILAAEGVEEGKTAGEDPEKTGHIPGLRGRYGHEHMTGSMWQFCRDVLPNGYVRLFGGYWLSSGAGSRRSYFYDPADANFYVGARGRCDHLILG